MGRAFEYRKAAKLKRWGHMAKTFTKLGKQIAIAVKAGGPEPENNPTLRSIIATCKRENMPKDNIERAIKNAMGKDQSEYKNMTYEGYGPHGIAVFVDTLTDNPTRTVADVRSVFNKFSGTLGTMGSLAYLFDHKCVFTFKKPATVDMDELILDLIDFGVEEDYDMDEEEGMFGEGISKMSELIDVGVKLGIVQKSGAWFNYGDIRLGQGRDNAKLYLKEHPDVAAEIEKQVRENADRLLAAGKKGTVKPLEKPAVTPVAAEDAPAAPMADAPKTTGSEMDLDIMVDE